jgi:alpha-tubulin suppressor-like RCC1 family protein
MGSTVIQISEGATSLALKSDGAVYAWGANISGNWATERRPTA